MPWDLQTTLLTAWKDVQQLVKMAGLNVEEMSGENILAAKAVGRCELSQLRARRGLTERGKFSGWSRRSGNCRLEETWHKAWTVQKSNVKHTGLGVGHHSRLVARTLKVWSCPRRIGNIETAPSFS